MKCSKCGNEDSRYFARRNGEFYCRKCLTYNGKTLSESSYLPKTSKLTLNYPLSKEQDDISSRVIDNFKSHKNCLIYAVTGAGKTELIYGVIEHCLKQRKRVGFAVPRVDIVRELLARFQKAFNDALIAPVYGNHSEILEGDIVILTTHQLYRYPNYFDLLILDEIDAFPFKGDEQLEYFFRCSVRGNYILMSATPDQKDMENIKKDNGEVFSLMKRYHGDPMPVPVFVKDSIFPRFQVLRELQEFIQHDLPVLIFVPSIDICLQLASFLNMFLKNGGSVSSKHKERKEIIEKFKCGEIKYLVTTTILERGITIKNLQVIIFNADDNIFDSKTIIQIAGRVGRKIGATGGNIIIHGKSKTSAIREAIRTIEQCNNDKNLFDLS